MRFISTIAHGITDYLLGVFLIVSPWIYHFADGGAQTWVPIGTGLLMLLQAFMTRFEMGVFKWIPMVTHVWVDFCAGLFLAASPWLFDFNQTVWLAHLIFGLMVVLSSLLTRTVTPHVPPAEPVAIVKEDITENTNLRF